MFLPEISVDELRRELDGDQPPMLIDVREPWEVAQGAINGAMNVPLGSLAAHLRTVSRDARLVLICQSGSRSRAATDVLDRAGWHVRSLKGGMGAWTRTAAA